MCAFVTSVCVCLCVWVCVQNTPNKEIKVTGHETWSNQKRRNETPIDYGWLVHVFQQGPCLGQEWRNNSQWQIRTLGPLVWKYSKRHKQAHDFCCVVVCVCTRKQRWRFENHPKSIKSGGISKSLLMVPLFCRMWAGLWKCCTCVNQGPRLWRGQGPSEEQGLEGGGMERHWRHDPHM